MGTIPRDPRRDIQCDASHASCDRFVEAVRWSRLSSNGACPSYVRIRHPIEMQASSWMQGGQGPLLCDHPQRWTGFWVDQDWSTPWGLHQSWSDWQGQRDAGGQATINYWRRLCSQWQNRFLAIQHDAGTTWRKPAGTDRCNIFRDTYRRANVAWVLLVCTNSNAMDLCAATTPTSWTWTPTTEDQEAKTKTQQDKHQIVQNAIPMQFAHLSALALRFGATAKTSWQCNGHGCPMGWRTRTHYCDRQCATAVDTGLPTRTTPPGNPACDGKPELRQLAHSQGFRHTGRPNGNDEHLHTVLTITDHGRYLLDVVAQHISYEIKAHQIRERLLNATRLLRAVPTPVRNDKHPPVVLELDKALFHPADPCTDHLTPSDMPIAHEDKVTQPRCNEGGSQASKEGSGEFRVYVGDDALDDDDGLIVSWPALPCRNPIEFLEDLPEEFATILRNYDNATDQHDDYLHIYTDGSAGWFDGDKRSSWAFIVFKSKNCTPNAQNMSFVDWFGSITQEDPMSPDWTGALEHSSRSGEAEAIAWAILWSLQRHPPYHIIIHSDATSVLHAATGQWNFPDNNYLLLRVRALYKVLWTLMTDEYVDIKHVQAHAGYAGNEIVDLIAKKICARQEEARIPSISLAKWMHGHPPLIEWAWSMVDNLYRDGEVPRYEDRHFKWTMWRRPDTQLQWLPNIPTVSCVTKDTSQLCCTIASYNVGSLKEAAKSAYLRQQLQFYKIAIAALQETRVAYEDAPDSNYMRFIAKANCGIGGCELWVSLTLPYNGNEQHPRYFQRKNFQALVAEPQTTACSMRRWWTTSAFCHGTCTTSRHWIWQGLYVVGKPVATSFRLWTWQTYCLVHWRQRKTWNHDATCRTAWRTWRRTSQHNVSYVCSNIMTFSYHQHIQTFIMDQSKHGDPMMLDAQHVSTTSRCPYHGNLLPCAARCINIWTLVQQDWITRQWPYNSMVYGLVEDSYNHVQNLIEKKFLKQRLRHGSSSSLAGRRYNGRWTRQRTRQLLKKNYTED